MEWNLCFFLQNAYESLYQSYMHFVFTMTTAGI